MSCHVKSINRTAFGRSAGVRCVRAPTQRLANQVESLAFHAHSFICFECARLLNYFTVADPLCSWKAPRCCKQSNGRPANHISRVVDSIRIALNVSKFVCTPVDYGEFPTLISRHKMARTLNVYRRVRWLFRHGECIAKHRKYHICNCILTTQSIRWFPTPCGIVVSRQTNPHVTCPVCYTQVVRALDTSQTIAATQQILSFSVFVGFEAYRAITGLKEGTNGRASIVPTVAGIASMIAVRPWHPSLNA